MTPLPATTRPRARNLALAIAVFALVGPLIGGFVMVAFVYVMDGRFEPVTREMLRVIVWLSYLFGGLQALLTGLGTAMLACQRGGSSFWHLVLVVAAIHLVYAALVAGVGLASGRPAGPPFPFLAILSPVLSLIAATGCWLIARPLLKPAEC